MTNPRSRPKTDSDPVDREELERRFIKNNARTDWLFSLLEPDAYYLRPIPLRNPIVFYEGHLAAFAVNTLIKGALQRPGVDERLEQLFARGIDPEDEKTAAASGLSSWPSRDDVRDYVDKAHAAVLDAIRNGDIDDVTDPLRRNAASAWTVVEHDPMHHETLLYMWHRLPYELKRRPSSTLSLTPQTAVPQGRVVIPEGMATLGSDGEVFGWDNEFPQNRVHVSPFDIDIHDVTNGQYLDFVRAGCYNRRTLWDEQGWAWKESAGVTQPAFWLERQGEWFWRGMFEELPLPSSWPVYVSHAEASAYARWVGRSIPSEAEYHRAAFGTPDGSERLLPWQANGGENDVQGNYDFRSFDPVPVGSFPEGASAWGVHDLIGNGWEWTSTPFAGFKGFSPMAQYPVYSADFFDGEHFVIKGASPATARELVRPGFRNWFRFNYPYVYATFRTVSPL